MHLKRLYLHNFRNYEKATVVFEQGINFIQGLNAQGKTNLLEALFFLSMGRSFRTAHLTDLIRHSQSFFYLEAEFHKDGIAQSLKVSFDGQARRVEYNQTSYNSFSNLLGLLPTVLYAPGDAALITGAPAERRRFLDLQIAQVDPLYVHHLIRYFKAMKHRNHLLRRKDEAAILPWEQAMSSSALYLVQKRIEATSDLQGPLKRWMQQLSEGKDTLKIHYQPSVALQNWGENPFQKWRKKELLAGNTLMGPHRDDLIFTIDETPARVFASEGQKRSAIGALRLAEWERLHQITGSPPIMSIDDFGIHLDAERHTLFEAQLANLGQVFLTSPLSIEKCLSLPQRHLLTVEKGKIIQDSAGKLDRAENS